jgi:hypothetical protein
VTLGVDNSDRDMRIVAQYEAGESCQALGAAHGLTEIRVWQILRAAGVRMRNAGRAQWGTLSDESLVAVIREAGRPLTRREMEERLGVKTVLVATQGACARGVLCARTRKGRTLEFAVIDGGLSNA